jgi:putative transposase
MLSEVKMLLDLGIVQPSDTPWISAPVIVKKHDGTLRLCIDFRPLNKVTVPDPYPLPVIDAMLRRMSRAQYFSSVDIASAFWQVPMHTSDKKYTGFMTPNGKYEWLRKPFECHSNAIRIRTQERIKHMSKINGPCSRANGFHCCIP